MGYLKTDRERFVGLFYWMWISNTNYYYHNIFDCTKLMATEEGAAAFWNIDPSNAAYQQLSQIGAFHFTNEPLYGYYNSSDPWVITRHMELFILAGIDFIFLDTSNSLIYDEDIRGSQFEGVVKAPSYTLLDTMLELYEKGWDVPKVVFLTNTRSGERVEEIRRAFYDSGKYEALWFKPDGVRPMIIATTEQNDGASDTWGDVNKFVPVSAADQLYFDVKETQWPNKGSKPNGFPWISNRAPQTYHEESKAIQRVRRAARQSGLYGHDRPQQPRLQLQGTESRGKLAAGTELRKPVGYGLLSGRKGKGRDVCQRDRLERMGGHEVRQPRFKGGHGG